jgi:hypothetical protein
MAIPTMPPGRKSWIEGAYETDESQQVTIKVDQDNLTLCAGDARKRWNASSTATGDREFRLRASNRAPVAPRPNRSQAYQPPRSSGALAKARSSEPRPLDRRWVGFATPVAREQVGVPSALEKQ